MRQKGQGTKLSRRVLAAVLAAIAWACAYPPLDGNLLLIVFAFPLLLFSIDGSSVRECLALSMLFSVLGLGMGCHWLYNVFGLQGMALVPLVSINLLIFALGARLILTQVQCWRFAEVSAWWTAVEFFRSELAPLSNASMTFGESVPTGVLLQVARHVGVYGLSFLVALSGALVYRIYCYYREGKDWRRAVVLPILLFLLWPLWGSLASQDTKGHGSVACLAVQAEDLGLEDWISSSESALAEHPDARVVLWPEWALREPFFLEDEKLRERLSSFASKNSVYLVFGNKRRAEGGGFYNTAFVLGPSGELLGYSGKSRPVPFMNDGKPTADPNLVTTPFAELALPICYDVDFSLVVRNLAKRGAELFFVPTGSRLEWGWAQHMQRVGLLRLRAVETARFFFRVNCSGPSLVIAPDGTQREGLFSSGKGYVYGEVEILQGETVYVKWGYCFAPLCTFVSFIAIFAAWRSRI